MKNGNLVAASFLALGFVAISVILVAIEPGMGFAGPADYFDPAKVLVGIKSLAWLLGDLIYLGFSVALAYLALGPLSVGTLSGGSDDRYLRASGLAAAVAFLFIASLGRTLAQLPFFISDSGRLEAAVLGLTAVRFGALKTMVVALGVFAWRTTRASEAEAGSAVRPGALWRGFGYLILVASVVFVFVFVPVPLLFAVWAVWFAARQARGTKAS